MQLAHDPVAFIFSVPISPHVSEAEPGPDHPMHMPKLACGKKLGMLSSNPHPTSVPAANLSG